MCSYKQLILPGWTGATDGEEDEDLSWDVDEEKDTEDLILPGEGVVEEIKATEATPSLRSIEVPPVASVEGEFNQPFEIHLCCY